MARHVLAASDFSFFHFVFTCFYARYNLFIYFSARYIFQHFFIKFPARFNFVTYFSSRYNLFTYFSARQEGRQGAGREQVGWEASRLASSQAGSLFIFGCMLIDRTFDAVEAEQPPN